MILFLLIPMGILYAISFLIPDIKNKKASTLFGSAHFKSKSKSILSTEHTGVTVDGQHKISLEKSFDQVMLISPTGSGKTSTILIPSLINHALDATSNVVVVDPKSELTDMLTPIYEQQGYTVLCLDFDSNTSIGFNPLKQCFTEDDIKQLANDFFLISQKNSKNSEAIWGIGAKRLLQIGISCILNLPDVRLHTIETLINFLHLVEDGTLRAEYFVKANAPNQSVIQRWESYSSTESKIKLGYLATARTFLDEYDTSNIKHLSSFNTFPFNEIKQKKLAIFLKLKMGTATKYGSFLSLLFTQFFRHLLNKPLSKGDRPLFIYLEELQNIKKINLLERSVSYFRSRQISLICITQNLSALDYIYGKESTTTLLSNTNSVIILPGVREQRSLSYLEKIMGFKTEQSFIQGRVHLSRRALMNQDEIRTMKHGLLIYGSNQPEKFTPTPIYKNQALMEKAGLISIDGEIKYKEPYIPQTRTTLPPYQPVTIERMLDPEKEATKEKLAEILSE